MNKKLFFASLLLAASPYVYGEDAPLTGDDERYVAPSQSKKTERTPVRQPAAEPERRPAAGSTETSSAQTITVRGLVTDNTLEPVVGAEVYFSQGDNSGVATTDRNGEYELKSVPENADLEFSANGLITQTAHVNGRTRINVRMEKGKPRTTGKVSYEKNPWIAGGLSVLLPGGGQYYNGHYLKGGIMTGILVGSIIVIGSGALADDYSYDYYGYGGNEDPEDYSWIFALVIVADYAWSIADAIISANKINRGEYLTWNVGKKSALSLRPDMLWASTFNRPYASIPACGVSLKLKW
jgi:hypothetical protein